jgi:septum formation topological specificity factor MinE
MADQRKEEALWLQHHRNILQLSLRQLQALERQDVVLAQDCAEQKQMILNYVEELQAVYPLEQCQRGTKQTVHDWLQQIIAYEQQSRNLLQARRSEIMLRLFTARQSDNINKAYGTPLNSGYYVNAWK